VAFVWRFWRVDWRKRNPWCPLIMAPVPREPPMQAVAIAGRPMGMSMSPHRTGLARQARLMRAVIIAAHPARAAMCRRIMAPALRGRLTQGPAIAASNLLERCLFEKRGSA